MASGYRSALGATILLALVSGLAAQTNIGGFSIKNAYALHADTASIAQTFFDICLNSRFTSSQRTKETPSIETLIEFVERLEEKLNDTTDPVLMNFKTPDMIARLLLQRFNIEGFQYVDTKKVDEYVLIDTHILGAIPSNIINNPKQLYEFPDNVFEETERCTLFNMFSHAYINSALGGSRMIRNRRDVYTFPRNGAPTNSPWLPVDGNGNGNTNGQNQNYTREMGVVSFRGDVQEAIAPARVFYGIIAAFASNAQLSVKEIANKRGVGSMSDDSEGSLKDPVLAVTFGSLVGRAIFSSNQNSQSPQPIDSQIFGISGRWSNQTCGTQYTLDSSVNNYWNFRRSVKGSLAEMRGALDGYIIGKALQSISQADAQKLRLSTILKSYYSQKRKNPGQLNSLKASFCDRLTLRPQENDLNEVADNYARLYKFYSGQDGSGNVLRRDLFSSNFNKVDPSNEAVCQAPTGNYKCETPSDLIFVVDGKEEYEYKSAMFVQQIVSRIANIGRYAGAVSVFYSGSGSVPGVVLPGNSNWPLGALAFNNTNMGALTCALTPDSILSGNNNFAKYLQNINTTLTQYKWWGWRRQLGGVPSRNTILLSLSKMSAPTTGQDASDIDTYRKALKYRARDVLFLVASPDKALYTDLVRDDKFIVTENNIDSNGNLATEWAKQICANPATLQYNDCRDRASNNYTHTLFVTPGAQQNWAVYPEYFRLSEDLDITVSGVDGDINVCWDNSPIVDDRYCHDVTANSGYGWRVSKPCKGESIHTCKPIYISVRGKELKSKPFCSDAECQNLEQIKVTISHTGMRCGACSLTVSLFLTALLALIPGIVNRFF